MGSIGAWQPQHLHYIRHKEERLLGQPQAALSEGSGKEIKCAFCREMFADLNVEFTSE